MVNMEHLCFSYTGAPPYILNDINLEIEDGNYLSILGDNGSGKTTLIRILLGFLKPSKGSISIDTRHIGYVPQTKDFNNQSFPITVYEVLSSYHRLLKRKNKLEIIEALKLTGMEYYRDTLMGKLSGGQQQKILIARALLGSPKLLILDEPSTGIDIDSQKEIYGLLKRMCTEQKLTILAVEHNLEAVIANSTQIFHIHNGHGHLCSPDIYAAEYLNYKKG